MVLASVDVDLAFVRSVLAADDLHEGRLARAVFTANGVHFARADVETDVLQRDHARKTLADAVQAQQGLVRHGVPCRMWRAMRRALFGCYVHRWASSTRMSICTGFVSSAGSLILGWRRSSFRHQSGQANFCVSPRGLTCCE